jgi:hypothetical protein
MGDGIGHHSYFCGTEVFIIPVPFIDYSFGFHLQGFDQLLFSLADLYPSTAIQYKLSQVVNQIEYAPGRPHPVTVTTRMLRRHLTRNVTQFLHAWPIIYLSSFAPLPSD